MSLDVTEHHTPLLDGIHSPDDLKKLSVEQLPQLADELRRDTIHTVAGTGGHLGASLGVVELTVALHYLFDTPRDKVIWDVGHQAYPHKILTGRRDRMHTIRQEGGLSGFTKRGESAYDPFGAGHSSTSISAGLGMAVARDFLGNDNEVIAVIGDGAMSAGMAYEALNNAGSLGSRLIVILNDNDMSIAQPTGAMSAYLARLASSSPYHTFRDIGRAIAQKFPEPLARAARHAEHYARGVEGSGNVFEQLGMYYVGPIDGHNLSHLVPVLRNIRDEKDSGPVLLHVVTKKGYGYLPAEAASDKYHGVAKFDVRTGAQKKSEPKAPSYTSVFAKGLIAEAAADESVVAVTAAMPSGTGLDKFSETFPDRCFDVGIAEQHAVTFAAGLAAEGMKPFVAIYSTFLQRAYDQIVHDVAIQNLPVRFGIDRAGLVGADGPTHAGSFDIAYLGCLPNMVLMAASDEVELMHMIATAAAYDDGPSAVRYPRGEAVGLDMPERGTVLEIGKGRVLREGSDVALFCYGTRTQACVAAAGLLEKQGISVTVADARFAKPLDEALVKQLVEGHALTITVEEGSVGGFGSLVQQYALNAGLLDGQARLRSLTLPDTFQQHAAPEAMYAQAGLDTAAIADYIQQLVNVKKARSKQSAA